MQRNWNPCVLLVEISNCAATIENNMTALQNMKQNYHMIQKFHFWIYTQMNRKQRLT